MPLTPKHEQVAQLVAKGISGTQAYLAIYPNSSEEAARRNASRLLTNDDVRARVQELSSKAADGAVASATDLLNRLWEIGQSDEKDRVPALAAMRSFYPEFKDASINIDARTLVVGEGKL